jgi:hypothetical protein
MTEATSLFSRFDLRVERKLPSNDRLQRDSSAETVPAAKHPHRMGVGQSQQPGEVGRSFVDQGPSLS